ncbi:hypothetical protein BDZ94DRAFT_1256273 [Collybia nuda]|uniref:Uncharacterized protein n=1 Tax=Collybia nuda TaxID=64659 RepID=A0A9P6CKZ3_9AGAR|nr:hypothetical protein BDZ94DRAFT_1256273 [Collybia nuda]
MKIEWASSVRLYRFFHSFSRYSLAIPLKFRADGTRRRPPPSTMHGWLAKMRGTLIGDETAPRACER